MEGSSLKNVQEKVLKPMGGGLMLLITLVMLIGSVPLFILGVNMCIEENMLGIAVIILAVAVFVMACIMFAGFKIIRPNEALVLTLFGKYYGTIKHDGWFWVNPFASAFNPTVKPVMTTASGQNQLVLGADKRISTKALTLDNAKQKVNDALGNPIIIGSVVIWRVADPTKAVFNVENYKNYLSIQCDSIIRNVARLYPYDSMDDESDEKTLRGSSQEIADQMETQLQKSVADAGLEIVEVRITHLAYSEEIAAAMLQRQQAVAIIAARQKIVEGAVSMVKMAIDQLGEEDIVTLDEERKAAMVSNLLVVLCGNKDAQPIVNSGSIY